MKYIILGSVKTKCQECKEPRECTHIKDLDDIGRTHILCGVCLKKHEEE